MRKMLACLHPCRAFLIAEIIARAKMLFNVHDIKIVWRFGVRALNQKT
jgi:hypothetical protein